MESDAEEGTLSPPHDVALAVAERAEAVLPLLQPHALLLPLQPAAAGDTLRERTMCTYKECPLLVFAGGLYSTFDMHPNIQNITYPMPAMMPLQSACKCEQPFCHAVL
jgi:hypothetical protein